MNYLLTPEEVRNCPEDGEDEDDREVTEALSVRQEGPQLNQVLVKLIYGGLLATIGPSAYKMLISFK